MNKNRKMVIVLLLLYAFLFQAVLYRTESKNIPVTRNNAI